MSRRTRRLLYVAGGLVGIVVIAVLALPFLVDVNDYRGTIEAKAREALGREVRLGDMGLSVFPRLAIRIDDVAVAALPEEGGGDLLSVARLRVGVRLLPLLSSRLEVTTLSVEQPSMTLSRNAAGEWNVKKLLAGNEAGEATGTADAGGGESSADEAGAGFSVDRLAIRGARLELRDAALATGRELRLDITDLDLDLSDLAPDRELELSVAAVVKADGQVADPTRLTLEGKVGPLVQPEGEPLPLTAEIHLEQIDPVSLSPWIEALAGAGIAPPGGILGAQPFSLGANLAAEIASGAGQVSSLRLDGIRLDGPEIHLGRSREGDWNFDALMEPAGGGESAGPAPDLSIADVEISGATIHLLDEGGAAPVALRLEDLQVTLDRLPTEAAAQLSLATSFSGGGETGRLSLQGELGPLADAWPAALTLALEDAPLAVIGSYLRELLEVEIDAGNASLSLQVAGDLQSRFEATGNLELDGARVLLGGAADAPPSAPLDLAVDLDVAAAGGGSILELRQLDVALPGATVRIRGNLDLSGDAPEVDLSLLPTEVGATELASLLALAGMPSPLSFSSPRPLSIEAQVRGALTEERYPSINARMSVEDLTFRHPSMAQPMEGVRGIIQIKDDNVEITDFAGRVGNSDLAGTLSVRGFEAPDVRFDLRSQRADFWELLSFASGESSEGTAGAAAEAESTEFLDLLQVSGSLSIASGSFDTLDFSNLQAGLRLAGQQLTLDPFSMDLYQGAFSGTAEADLSRTPTRFEIQSRLQEVDVDALLADTLELPDTLSGRLSGSLTTHGSGSDFESVVNSLAGQGKLEVSDGGIGKLDVLKMLTKAADVFGEQTLRSVSTKLETEGTPFTLLSSGDMKLEGPFLQSDAMVLESPDITLQGAASLNLLTAVLDGKFQILFSEVMSRSMRDEKSRAAEVFWDPGLDRVNLPLALAGPVDAPTPNIDWGKAVGSLVTRKATDELRKRLGGLLGESGEKPAEEQPAPAAEDASGGAGSGLQATSDGTTAPEGMAAAPPATAATDAADPEAIGAVISGVRWGGNLLARDLKLNGKVQGRNIDRVSLQVTDAGGRTVEVEDGLEEVESYFQAGADRGQPHVIAWDAKVDGKKLLLARFPVTVTVTVFDTTGGQVDITREVDR